MSLSMDGSRREVALVAETDKGSNKGSLTGFEANEGPDLSSHQALARRGGGTHANADGSELEIVAGVVVGDDNRPHPRLRPVP